MAEVSESVNPSAGIANPPNSETDQPILPSTATPAPAEDADTSLPALVESSTSVAVDTELPHIDTTLPHIDTSLPPIDTTLPAIESTIPALPSIDTSMPTFDTTLPTTGSEHSFGEPNQPFPDEALKSSDAMSTPFQVPGSGDEPIPVPAATGDTDQSRQQGSYTPGSQPQYSHSPAPNGTYQQYSQPLHQQQSQQPAQQNHDMYHNPPPASGQMNGPPMHTMDNHSGQVPQAPIGSPMPPMASMGQYMQGYPNNMAQPGMASNMQMRYQIPGDPSKLLAGGRHKKEVKRRTKTGCLTCRKRRIKCDEGHPVCRNCVKSKRECLGYDPVFRQQPTTPSAIQPAPNPPPSLVVNPQDPSANYSSAPPGYMPAASQPFAPSLHSESPAPSTEQFDYGGAIESSLDGNNSTINNTTNNTNTNNSSNMASLQNVSGGNLQPPVDNGATGTTPLSDSADLVGLVKQCRIHDLLALRGIAPPPPHPIVAIAQTRSEEIQAVFLATYAPAIDRFLETRWFQEKALHHLMANSQLVAEYSALIDAFNDRNLTDPNVVARLESFEASIVWSTMDICRRVPNLFNGNHEQDPDHLAASTRLDVIEALITGEHLDLNPLEELVHEPSSNPPSLPDQLHQRILDFWNCIGHFLTLHDNEASSGKEIDDTLGRCRTLLDTYENRDVIYSIAIARHLGQRWADFPRSLPHPITTNEKDAGAKLFVAQRFLEQEASGKGTTQVIKRVCGMVIRSWIVSRE
ncbi:hypothetical protein ASPZODRAFT_61087 [Penicilliopsis zonata CBS 506.65]|uniref:Zn(2)-C6 fungal-type domain-containing protein n=1 Tax=Penicilliopsis zonata CBS 506.65 TaxID=1073090 RepID=A0A1L9SQ90_9EURO|nr:hypothetical protein ASPZODRAFT_61087 [Penicilliopsis zonata CBS 506.65]OJJ49405.1 hypothetical protein ASPZODRAFT_61087 [Penicilliopsis zonata CBS 506.65]